MSLMDAKGEFSDGQSLATAAGNTIESTNVVDLGAADPDIGEGNEIWVNCLIGSSVTCTSDTGTVTPVVKHSTDNSSWSKGTFGSGDESYEEYRYLVENLAKV
jgi:hypothetical protein